MKASEMESSKRLISLSEAALILGVTTETVHQYATRGILPVALKVGRTRYYRNADVLKLKKRRGKGFPKGRRKAIEADRKLEMADEHDLREC